MPGTEDYAYIHEDDQPAEPKGLGATEATPGELNPAYYFENAGGALVEEGVEAPELAESSSPSEVVNAQRGAEDPMGFPAGITGQSVVAEPVEAVDPTRPDGNDSTAKWREWAIKEKGVSADEAKTLSRLEIQKRY